jgi:hypothetical protein
LHFSSPAGGWPKTLNGDPDGRRLFEYLKQIDYHGGISIGDSARGTFEEDAAASLAFFRKELT